MTQQIDATPALLNEGLRQVHTCSRHTPLQAGVYREAAFKTNGCQRPSQKKSVVPAPGKSATRVYEWSQQSSGAQATAKRGSCGRQRPRRKTPAVIRRACTASTPTPRLTSLMSQMESSVARRCQWSQQQSANTTSDHRAPQRAPRHAPSSAHTTQVGVSQGCRFSACTTTQRNAIRSGFHTTQRYRTTTTRPCCRQGCVATRW
jgi:hypothetical protein